MSSQLENFLTTPLLLFVLGVITGSFLNVLGLRWGSASVIRGRSFCFSCKKKLRWWELVPILSFLLLGGRCSGCKSKISWQYLVVEAWTGVLFASLYHIVSPSDFASWLVLIILISVFSIYTVIMIYDARHKIIPDELVLASIVLAGLLPLFLVPYTLYDLLAGPAIFSVFALVWLLSGGRALGLGDAKLGASIGLLLGAARGSSAVVLAFWIGTLAVFSYALVSYVSSFIRGRSSLLSRGKRLTMKSEIPFGPFLILGAWISLVFNLNLLYVSVFQ